MALSNVAIANRALQKLGAKRIESLTENSPNARSINAAFAQVRDMELRRYDWNFAIKRASIAADGSDSTWGNWNRYSLPNDFLRLIRDNETGIEVDWKIEGIYILSADASPLQIRYIARIEDPNYYDPLFVAMFAGRLAMEVAIEISGGTSKKDSVAADYKTDLEEAKKLGAFEKAAQEFNEDEWIAARR